MTSDQRADALIGFYRRLIDGGVDAQVAGVVTIDFHKALMAGEVQPEPSPIDLDQAAKARRQRREQQLAVT